jgi:glycerol-3-phosphate acyltransferase PlsY
MTSLLISILIAYLLGSVSGSLLLGRLKHVDIRTMGSGNAGGTNAFRTQGLLFAIGVVIIDVGKGILATWLIPRLAMAELAVTPHAETTMLACAFAAVLGHCFPVYHGFRGGKGAATVVGGLLVIQPWLLVPMLSTWLVTLGLTGYVSVSTIVKTCAICAREPKTASNGRASYHGSGNPWNPVGWRS